MESSLKTIISKCVKATAVRLSDIAVDTAKTAFSSQVEDGNTNYKIKGKANGNGFTVTASGEDIGFLEFGAGHSVETDSLASDVPYAVKVGSYSDSHNGMFKRTGYKFWKWNGKFYKGISATHGMENAADEIENRAEEVFGEELDKLI